MKPLCPLPIPIPAAALRRILAGGKAVSVGVAQSVNVVVCHCRPANWMGPG